MAYIVVTGAAGFIGSNLVKALNERGVDRIIAVDHLADADKFFNLVDCEIADYLDKSEFLERLRSGQFDGEIDTIFHQGACSDTMETDGYYVMENNYRYSLELLDWCLQEDVQFLYASSAATYGAGKVFREERQHEAPLNIYGYSKFLFDQVVRKRLPDALSQVVGFRYFNVYGPREQHKGRMASVAYHHFQQYQKTGKVKLFEGSHGYAAGEQQRDFVYITDVVKVNLWFWEHRQRSGIFNLGTGRAQSFNDVAVAAVNSMRMRALHGTPSLTRQDLLNQGILEYVPFPQALEEKYQAFTQADLTQLRTAGYVDDFMTVEQGVAQYNAWMEKHV